MDHYLIQPKTVTISLDDYLRLKHDAEAIENFKKGFVLETNWWNGEYKFYSLKYFETEIADRIKRETNVAKNLKKQLDKLSKMSIFEFWKFKRTYSYTSYP